MNVNDVKDVPESTDYLGDIFKRQGELLKKYGPIESRTLGIPQLNIGPFEKSLDDKVFQFKIKEHLWRVVEEVAESYEVYLEGNHFEHQVEELADALHFMVETMILVEIDSSHIKSLDERYTEFDMKLLVDNSVTTPEVYNAVFYRVGIVGNTLKNKPWKQSQMRTDVDMFYKKIKKAFDTLLILFFFLGLKPVDIYNIYFKKSEVNKFRQRSNY